MTTTKDSMFKPATREQNRLRLAIDGAAGSGKSYTALRFAFTLGKKICVIDTENGSMGKYVGDAPDGVKWQFDTCVLKSGQFAPSTYASTIRAAGAEGYDVIIVDSLSHAWSGAGGALEQVDRASGNNFTAWRDVTPQHNAMISAILESPAHIICTLRSKMEYVMEPDASGKVTVKKVGLKPIQRQGVEYEFDLIADMDINHTMTVSKSRCSVVDGQIVSKPTAAFMTPVLSWLRDGVQPEARPKFAAALEPVGKLGAMKLNSNPADGSAPPPLPTEEEKKTVLIKEVKMLLAKTNTPIVEVIDWLRLRGKEKLGELSYKDLHDYKVGLQLQSDTNQQQTAF